MNIKINNSSNFKDDFIFIPNLKIIIDQRFDKELQENKKNIKQYLKISSEIESKNEVLTNNLIESPQYNWYEFKYKRSSKFFKFEYCNYNKIIILIKKYQQ